MLSRGELICRLVARTLAGVGVASALLGSAACVVGETHPPDRYVVVSGPPPAPIEEQRPAPPGRAVIWVAGYWHWAGDRYAWIPGHWDQPPAGARGWHAPHYSFVDGSYRYEPGTWKP